MTDQRPLNLADLIKKVQAETGKSYDQIARDSGLSKAKIGQLARHDDTHAPRIDTLRKLATGLSMPLRVVQSAAMVTAGVDSSNRGRDAQLTDMLTTRIEELSADDLEIADAMISGLVNLRKRQNG